MKKSSLILLVILATILSSCKQDETITCTITWQLYTHSKYTSATDIEKAFQNTYFAFYERVNDNTCIARHTTKADVRSLTIKLATMADAKIEEPSDPSHPVEVRVFINYANRYTEEVWSKTY